jgi:hypothetical protein
LRPRARTDGPGDIERVSISRSLACGDQNLKPSTQFAVPVRYPTTDLLKTQSKPWLVLLTLLICGIFLYLQVFVLPGTPRLAIGDQSIYLHNAARMYEGQLIYRDFDYFTLPGTDVLYVTLFKLFGVRAWIPQMMLLLVGVISTWLSIKIATKVMSGPAVFLPGFLFLALPFASYLDATHHLYNVLFATCALAVVIEERTIARMAWAGAFWGLATCFAQSLVTGPLGFGLFLVWERHRKKEAWGSLLKKEGSLLASYLATVAAFNAYFVWKVGLKQFLYYTVTFVARYFSAYGTNTWRTYMLGHPSVHEWANWPDLATWPLIHFLIPLVYILFFVRYWREERLRPEEQWERLMLVNTTGLCLFLSIVSAPAWNRLYTVSMPALIMLVWFLNSSLKLERALLRILWATVMILAIARPIVTQTRWKAFLDLPTGRTAFFEPGSYQETKWLLERTRPSDYFFGDQLLCFDLRLRNPSRVAFVTPYNFTRPEEVSNVVQGLEEHRVRFVSWYQGLDDSIDAEGNHLAPLRSYLQSHYYVVESFENGHKMWERNNVTSLPRRSMTLGGGARKR